MPRNGEPSLVTNPVLCLAGQQVGTASDMIGLYQQRIADLGMSPAAMFYNNDSQHHDKLAAIAFNLRKHLSDDDSVLDVGCGYGQLVPFLPDCQYVGVELVETMVDEARHRYPRREFVCQDVANLGRTAQWAVLAGVLNSVPDPAQLLVDSWRQCRAGLIADVIRDGALPGSFTDLNRFQLMEVAEYLRSLGAHRVEAAVHAKYWSIVIAWKAQC